MWAFCPKKKGGHQGDYHKVFNGENFVTWWRDQLLPNLHQPSLIMLDNAAYHLVKGPDVPKPGRMKKAELQQYLTEKGVTWDAGDSAVMLRSKVKEWINNNEPAEIVRLAEEQGHQVLFTPPYHSDFQPIELVWALIKGNVGRQYNTNTTLDIVHNRLMDEFRKLEESGQESIRKMIEKCAGIARKFYDEMDQDDESDVENEENDDNNEENDDEMSTETVEGDDSDGDIEDYVEI